MKNLFNKDKLRGMGQISIFASFLLICTVLFKPTFKSKNDIKFISGQFKELSFTSYGRSGTSHLFWLKEYNSAFKISADFWSNKVFNQKEFYKLQNGDSIQISIHKSEHNYFEKSGKHNLIYSIKTPSKEILKIEDAIEIYNSNFMPFVALIFSVIGIVCLYFGYRKSS